MVLSSVKLIIAFGGKSESGALKLKLENMPCGFGGVGGMGAYVVDVRGVDGWDVLPLVAEGVRADKKSSVKKAREKAERMTMRGVRIATSFFAYVVLSCLSFSYFCFDNCVNSLCLSSSSAHPQPAILLLCIIGG